MPLGSTATYEPIEIPRSLWGKWKSPDDHRIKTMWIKKQGNPKQMNISDDQQPSGGQADRRSSWRNSRAALIPNRSKESRFA
ncbi:MAG: hypothetical protein RQ885_11830 [Desulfurococcales archaeon]|jgi:hypothetical protein|nr:hypothetical protein [Desulfurococcales archaeon]